MGIEAKYRFSLHNLILIIARKPEVACGWMNKMTAKKPQQVYKIDLTKIDGDGDFPCPKCGAIISPDDESEQVYTIMNTKMRGDILEELVITCNKCGSKIYVTGFLPG